MGLAAELGDLRPGLLEGLRLAGADRYVAAAGREAQRDRLADAPAAAANDGLLAREIYLHHALSLWLCNDRSPPWRPPLVKASQAHSPSSRPEREARSGETFSRR